MQQQRLHDDDVINVLFVQRLTRESSREKSVVNEIFGGYLRSQGMSLFLL